MSSYRHRRSIFSSSRSKKPHSRLLLLKQQIYTHQTTTPLHPLLNAPIHVEWKTLKHVASSAVEAETGGVYSNCTFAIPIRNMLKALGHPQGPTPIKTDNQTAASFNHNTSKSKRSKTWDMKYF